MKKGFNLIVDEKDILELARRNDEQEIRQFKVKVFVKKVEYILRCRCG